MVDIQDRRYLAQCVQHLPSNALADLLDLLLERHQTEVVERKNGESFHIDFGTLSTPAYTDVREFIKHARGDDDEVFDENARKTPLGKFEVPQVPPLISSSSATTNIEPTSLQHVQSSGNNEPLNQTIPAAPTEVTPPIAHLSTNSAGPVHPPPPLLSSNPNTTVSPEKRASNRTNKRARRSSPTQDDDRHETSSSSSRDRTSIKTKKEEGRYYNGERVWRHQEEDLPFRFHGVDVVLLSLKTDTKRPWKCVICEKAFVSKDKIVNHVQQHSGEKIHECPVCKGKFSSKHYLKEHQKRVHEFHCHHCDMIFNNFNELHVHSEQEHPVENPKSCSCKKGCNGSRCSCFKNGLNCNEACICSNCNNTA